MNFNNEHMNNQNIVTKNSTSSLAEHNSTSISSADYSLNVIFSQFENAADAKMSLILNLGVVQFKF